MRVRRAAEVATFAVLGDPVAHSASPAMHSAAMRVLGLPATYVALRPERDDVPAVMRTLIRTGGGGNATIPFKEIAAATVAVRSARVERLGVANTFWGVDGVLHGENTDVDGVLDALTALGVRDGGAWLILGTGGSARAAAAAATERGAAIAVRSREAARAEAFGAWAASAIGARIVPDSTPCAVVINATPLGLQPADALPIDLGAQQGVEAALDLVYAKGGTRWMQHARARGLAASDGRTMLLAQGVAAFRCWFPRWEPPVDVMRAALHEALGGWV